MPIFLAGVFAGMVLMAILWRMVNGAMDDPTEITDSQRIGWLEENPRTICYRAGEWRVVTGQEVSIRDISLRRAINRAMMEN